MVSIAGRKRRLPDPCPTTIRHEDAGHVAGDGTVTVLTGKLDIGQGPHKLLTQCVAEEMRVDPARVRLVMGDTAETPDDGGTYGSLTTPLTVPTIRQSAAAAPSLLRNETRSQTGSLRRMSGTYPACHYAM